MANKLYAGAMHWASVAYEDNPHRAKTRPVLILHIDGEKVYYYYITKQIGRCHQRKYRPSLVDWQSSGLEISSYIMIQDPPRVAYTSNFTNHTFIGDISQRDADEMSRYMNRLGY